MIFSSKTVQYKKKILKMDQKIKYQNLLKKYIKTKIHLYQIRIARLIIKIILMLSTSKLLKDGEEMYEKQERWDN